MMVKVEKIYKVADGKGKKLSLFTAKVPAGFPSPASDYEEQKLDLNKYLIRNPAATYLVRVMGDSMTGAGIHHGDILVVDRSIEPKDKKVIIANVNGELTVKRIRMRRGAISLEPENKKYKSQEIKEDMEFEIWGVVTNVIHSV